MKLKNVQQWILTTLLVMVLIIWVQLFSAVPNKSLAVSFLDVGQGDATFIQTPSGKQVLIDAGSGKQVLRELSEVMPLTDRSIDIVIATHPDQDHVGGMPDILERFSVDLYLKPGVQHDTNTVETVNTLLQAKNIQVMIARSDMELWLEDDIVLRILFPDRDVSEVESNMASIIAQLDYNEIEFLLTGDAPKSIENYLVEQYGEQLASEVLKVGHHGSKTSTSETFLGYVNPQFGIISAGADNRYGHPHQEVLDRLEQFDIVILNTATSGTVTFITDGQTVQRQ